jgi:hypothetical protein
MLKLNGTDGHTGLTEDEVLPEIGVPVHAVPEINETEPRKPLLFIPLVNVPPKPISVPVVSVHPPAVKG